MRPEWRFAFSGAMAEWAGVLGCFFKVWDKALGKYSLHWFCVASASQGSGSQIPNPRKRCGTVKEVGVQQPVVFLNIFLLSGLFAMNISFPFNKLDSHCTFVFQLREYYVFCKEKLFLSSNWLLPSIDHKMINIFFSVECPRKVWENNLLPLWQYGISEGF